MVHTFQGASLPAFRHRRCSSVCLSSGFLFGGHFATRAEVLGWDGRVFGSAVAFVPACNPAVQTESLSIIFFRPSSFFCLSTPTYMWHPVTRARVMYRDLGWCQLHEPSFLPLTKLTYLRLCPRDSPHSYRSENTSVSFLKIQLFVRLSYHRPGGFRICLW